MRKTLPLVALMLGGLALAGLTAPAQAEVNTTQSVQVRDESPESGSHRLSFRNYGERVSVHAGCTGGGKFSRGRCFRRVTKGTVNTKLSTYKLVEEREKYDYFLIDADMNVNRSGSSQWGWLHAILTTKPGTRIVDSRDTKSVSAAQGSCRRINLGLSTPWPVVGASADLGSVEFCSDEAHFKRSGGTASAEYKANRVGRTNHLSIQRWLKVPQGQKPRFKLRLELPSDKCTNYNSKKECTKFTNGSHAATYHVGTKR